MSGELKLSQLRFTTTADDDLVIGNPGTVTDHATKAIVFQTTTTPGWSGNPHFRCEWSGSQWDFIMNSTGGSDLNLSNLAYTDAPNSFSAANTFLSNVSIGSDNADTLTVNAVTIFNDNFTVLGNSVIGNDNLNTLTVNAVGLFNDTLTVNGNVTLGTTNANTLTVNSNTILNDDLNVVGNISTEQVGITLNKGGIVGSSGSAGIGIEEGGSIVAYAAITPARTSWAFLLPVSGSGFTLTPNLTNTGDCNSNITTLQLTSTRNYSLPNKSGTFAMLSDISTAGDLLGNVTIGTNDTNTLTINSVMHAYDDVTFSHGTTTIGTVDTDILQVLATGSFQHDVYIEGTLITNNDTVLGDNAATDTLTVHSVANFDSTIYAADVITTDKNITLKDQTTGTYYKLYMNNGILTVALA